jgi:serine/threonine-protein kinase HipA
MEILRGSERADSDRETFFRAQLVFWLLAATDGHAKNFSLVLLPGGRYRLAPLYDILSTYPVQGRGPNQVDARKIKLAMAVAGASRHYRLDEIHRWHWTAMATSLGMGDTSDALVEDTLARTERAIAEVGERLPADFPATLFDSVAAGMQRARKRIAAEPSRRTP